MPIKPRSPKSGGSQKKTPDTRVWRAPDGDAAAVPPRRIPKSDQLERPPGSRKPRWMMQIEDAKARKSAGEAGEAIARETRKERRAAARNAEPAEPATSGAPATPSSRVVAPPSTPTAAPSATAARVRRPIPGGRPEMALPPPHLRLRNIRLVVEYDGSKYAGWQIQPTAPTVAGSIEKALAEVLGEEVRLVGAGRTDEGVHAEGQVANFLSHWRNPADALVNAVNDRLPDDIAIIHAADVGPEFHSRHSATARVYRYHVVRRSSVFMRRRALHVTRPMDVTLMRQAADMIVGMHDFAAFTDLKLNQERSTKVHVTYAGWKDVSGQLIFRIAGSHFLARMVRRLVGSMVRVGLGDLPLATFKQWLDTAQGESAPLTAPSMGLVLEHVEYPAEILEAPKRERGVRIPRQREAPLAAASAPVAAAPSVAVAGAPSVAPAAATAPAAPPAPKPMPALVAPRAVKPKPAPAVPKPVPPARVAEGERDERQQRTHPVAERAAQALERGYVEPKPAASAPPAAKPPEATPPPEPKPPELKPPAPAPRAAPEDRDAIPRWNAPSDK